MRRRSRSGIGLASQLAVSGALVIAAIAAVARYGDPLAHDLRERLLWLTPERSVVAMLLVAFLLGAWALLQRQTGARGRTRHHVGELPVAALLALIVVTGSTFRLLLGRAATEPRFFSDELVYTGAAKSFALDWKPLVRGELDVGHSLLYPVFVSPAYRLASDGAQAFEAVKAMNAIAVVSAAIPAYLLARRLVPPASALIVAALVGFQPWTAYASLTMTESLFQPAFTTFVLLLARMLEHPSARRQLGVLSALVVLIGIRPQAFVLVIAVLAAIPFAGARHSTVGTLRAYAPLLVALGVGGAMAATLATVAGVDAPGSWAEMAASLTDPVGLVKWSLWNLAVYELALGVVGVVVFPLAVIDLLRGPSLRVRATGIALLTTVLALLVSLAMISASPVGLHILHERYLFYATPLLLVALVYWLRTDSGRKRRARLWLAVGGVAVAASLPPGVLARTNNVEGPAASWLIALDESVTWLPTRLLLVGLAALGGLVLLTSRTRTGPLLAVVAAFVALICGLDYSGGLTRAQGRQLAWVDRALPDNGRASLVHLGYSRPDQRCAELTGYEQQGLVVWTEFFNTRVDGVFHLAEEIERDQLDSPALTVGPGGVVLDRGAPFRPRYAVLDSRQPVVGRRLSRLDLAALGNTQYQEGASLTLWEVEPPLRFLVHAQPLPPRADERECT